jgi:hypothetical protein
MGAAAAGADSEFCASAGTATTPNSAAAIVTAKIRLLMNLLHAWREPMSCVREHGGQRWRKKSREVQGRNAAVLDRLRAMRAPGESYSDIILRLVEA